MALFRSISSVDKLL